MIKEIRFGYATREEAEALRKGLLTPAYVVQLVEQYSNHTLGYFVNPVDEWVELTDAEILDIEDEELSLTSLETFSFAKAIEAKVKEKNQ